MKTIILVLLVACGYEPGIKPSQAQSSGGGLTQVRVLDGGICSGLGLKGNPINCTLAVDNTTITGTGSAGSQLQLSTDGIGFAIFGDGSDGDITDATVPGSRDSFWNDVSITAGDQLSAFGSVRQHINGTLTIDAAVGMSSTGTGAISFRA